MKVRERNIMQCLLDKKKIFLILELKKDGGGCENKGLIRIQYGSAK